jgi:hypothetical protein
MPYVHRNAEGQIESLHREANDEAHEFLDDQHPDIKIFLGQPVDVVPEEFDRLDANFVRVIEDVIDTLIVKNIINITDLPAEAQAKLIARKGFRERISKNSLRLFESSQFGDVI